MKYAKTIRVSAMAITLAAMVGCAQQSVITQQQASAEGSELNEKSSAKKLDDVAIVDTNAFIPKQQYDQSGVKIHYSATENPYLLQEGVIKKGSVAIFITARRAYKSGDLELAKKTLNKLTKEDSSLAGPWVMLGNIAKQQNDLPVAAKCYSKAIAINPKNVNAYAGLALVQRLQGKFKHAQNTYAQALLEWKDFPEGHLNLAILYDIYLNQPLMAQKHMEAYQFLSRGVDNQVAQWQAEIQGRTGIQESFIDSRAKLAIGGFADKVDLAVSGGLSNE